MDARKQGYWDVNRCAWVAAPPHLGDEGIEPAAADQREVPEQRPGDLESVDAPTPA
jgi:hypothetical protein